MISSGFFESGKGLQVFNGNKRCTDAVYVIDWQKMNVMRLLGHDGFGHGRVFLYWLGIGCTKTCSGFFEILSKVWFNMGIPKFVVVIECNFPLFRFLATLTCRAIFFAATSL